MGKGHWVWGNVHQLQRLNVGITSIPSCDETAATAPYKYGNFPPKRDCPPKEHVAIPFVFVALSILKSIQVFSCLLYIEDYFSYSFSLAIKKLK